jgi:hypothetical protein
MSYTPLSGGTAISSGQDWSGIKFTVPIGFPFQIRDNSYDSLSITRSGFINLGDQDRTTLLAFLGFGCVLDTDSVYSSVSSQLTGTNGNRILKLEFKNCGLPVDSVKRMLSYQVWLYENNSKVEVHVGPNDYSGLSDSVIVTQVGIINPYMTAASNSCLLYGSPSSPQTQVIGTGEESMKGLIRIPQENSVLTIIRNN